MQPTLSQIYQEVFTVAGRIRAERYPEVDVRQFRERMVQAIASAEDQARRTGYSAEIARRCSLAVAALLDESAFRSQQACFSDWARQPLGPDFFGKLIAGETFFQILQELLSAPDSGEGAAAEQLEIYQTALLLGYRGKYGLGREEELRSIVNRVHEKLNRLRPLPARLVEWPAEPPISRPAPSRNWHWIAACGACALVLVLFAMYWLILRNAVNSLEAA